MRPFTTMLLSFVVAAIAQQSLTAQVAIRCVPVSPSAALPRMVPHASSCEQAPAGSLWGCDYATAPPAAPPVVQSVEVPAAAPPAPAPPAARVDIYIHREAGPVAAAPAYAVAPAIAGTTCLPLLASGGHVNVAEMQARDAYLAERAAPLGVPSTLYSSHAPPPPGWGPEVYGLHPAPLPFQRWLLRRRITEGALHSW